MGVLFFKRESFQLFITAFSCGACLFKFLLFVFVGASTTDNAIEIARKKLYRRSFVKKKTKATFQNNTQVNMFWVLATVLKYTHQHSLRVLHDY